MFDDVGGTRTSLCGCQNFKPILVHCTKFCSIFEGVWHHSFIVLSLELSEKLRRMKLAHPESRTHARIVNIELAVRAKFHV